jgi:hypothetical protein
MRLGTGELASNAVTRRENGVTVGDIETAPWGRFVTFDVSNGNGIVLQETTTG